VGKEQSPIIPARSTPTDISIAKCCYLVGLIQKLLEQHIVIAAAA